MVMRLSGVKFRGWSDEWFEITSTIKPELYDAKSFHQLILSPLTGGIKNEIVY